MIESITIVHDTETGGWKLSTTIGNAWQRIQLLNIVIAQEIQNACQAQLKEQRKTKVEPPLSAKKGQEK